jgi:hypothetical protein
MEQSSSKADSHSICQEIHRVLWNPKVYYRVHNNRPLDPIPNQCNPVHTLIPYLRPILKLSSHLCLGLPSVSSHQAFLIKSYMIFPAPTHATCSAHLVLTPKYYDRLEVLTAVKMTILFWGVTPCGLVGRN